MTNPARRSFRAKSRNPVASPTDNSTESFDFISLALRMTTATERWDLGFETSRLDYDRRTLIDHFE